MFEFMEINTFELNTKCVEIFLIEIFLENDDNDITAFGSVPQL